MMGSEHVVIDRDVFTPLARLVLQSLTVTNQLAESNLFIGGQVLIAKNNYTIIQKHFCDIKCSLFICGL